MSDRSATRKIANRIALGLALLLATAGVTLAQVTLNEIEFAADNSKILEKEYQVILDGNVHLKSADMELKGDQVVINFIKPAKEGDPTDVGTAQGVGHVWARNGDLEIVSESVNYDHQNQYAVFSGNAVVTEGNNKVRSSEVRLNLATGIYELVGGVRGKLSDFQ